MTVMAQIMREFAQKTHRRTREVRPSALAFLVVVTTGAAGGALVDPSGVGNLEN